MLEKFHEYLCACVNEGERDGERKNVTNRNASMHLRGMENNQFDVEKMDLVT